MRLIWGILFLAAISSCSRPQTIVCDFTTGFTLANANWPAGHADDLYIMSGRFRMVVKTSDGLTLDIPDVAVYSILRNGTSLQHIIITFGGDLNLEDAYRRAKKIMEDWHFKKEELDDLDRWHDYCAGPHDSGGIAGFVDRATIRIAEYSGRDHPYIYSIQIQISR